MSALFTFTLILFTLNKWKKSLESKGLRVIVGKTKIMVGDGSKLVPKCDIDLCSVCGARVGRNSIRCTVCMQDAQE